MSRKFLVISLFFLCTGSLPPFLSLTIFVEHFPSEYCHCSLTLPKFSAVWHYLVDFFSHPNLTKLKDTLLVLTFWKLIHSLNGSLYLLMSFYQAISKLESEEMIAAPTEWVEISMLALLSKENQYPFKYLLIISVIVPHACPSKRSLVQNCFLLIIKIPNLQYFLNFSM